MASNVWLSFLFIVPFQIVLKKRESSPGFWGSARWQWRHLGTPASPPGSRRSSQSCDLQIDNVDILRKWEWTTEKKLWLSWESESGTTDKALDILRKWKWNTDHPSTRWTAEEALPWHWSSTLSYDSPGEVTLYTLYKIWSRNIKVRGGQDKAGKVKARKSYLTWRHSKRCHDNLYVRSHLDWLWPSSPLVNGRGKVLVSC